MTQIVHIPSAGLPPPSPPNVQADSCTETIGTWQPLSSHTCFPPVAPQPQVTPWPFASCRPVHNSSMLAEAHGCQICQQPTHPSGPGEQDNKRQSDSPHQQGNNMMLVYCLFRLCVWFGLYVGRKAYLKQLYKFLPMFGQYCPTAKEGLYHMGARRMKGERQKHFLPQP